MEKQISFTDLEYGKRRKVTKREVFLTKMDAVLPWKEWVELVRPFFPDGSAAGPAGDRGDAAYADAAGMVPALR